MNCVWTRRFPDRRHGAQVVAVRGRCCRYLRHHHDKVPRGQVRWTWRERGEDGGTSGGEWP